jgi:hypothetical protein
MAEWSEELSEIFSEIATTPKSLEAICKANPSLPSARTVYRLIDSNEDICQRYTRAKEAQLQILADQLVDLADTDRICEKITIKADGSREVVILDQVERTKVQIDTRKWLLAKLAPKKYGDAAKLTLDGELGIKTLVVSPDAKDKTPRPALKPEFDAEE